MLKTLLLAFAIIDYFSMFIYKVLTNEEQIWALAGQKIILPWLGFEATSFGTGVC